MSTANDEDRLSETFAALANSTRRAIRARLADGAAIVNELARPFEMTLPANSKHIKVLERAGLVMRGHRTQYRPCALDAPPLEEASTGPSVTGRHYGEGDGWFRSARTVTAPRFFTRYISASARDTSADRVSPGR
jgi:DNA-binding transcriptional ArsR family regulator